MSLKQKPKNHEHPWPSGNQPWQRRIQHLSLNPHWTPWNPHEIPMKFMTHPIGAPPCPCPWTKPPGNLPRMHPLRRWCPPISPGPPVAHSGPVVEICRRGEMLGSGIFSSGFWRENIYLIYRTYRGSGMLSCYSDCCLTRGSLFPQQPAMVLTEGKFLSPQKLCEFLHSKIHMAQKSGNPKDWVFALKNVHQQNISPWSQMMCGSSSYPKLGRFGVFHFVWCSTPFLNHSNGAMNQTFAPPLTQLTGCFHPPWAEQQPGTSSPETTGRTPCNWLVASSEQHASASVFQPYFFCNHHPQKRKGLSLLVFNRIYIWSEWFKDILENPKN